VSDSLYKEKDISANDWRAGAVMAVILFAFIQVVLIKAGAVAVLDGALWDSDSYMWLNRVRHLWVSGAWFDPLYPRINPPAGLVQHWTRPMDVLLLLGAAPFSLAVGFETALHWWGVVISPLSLLIAICAVVWAARPVLRPGWLWVLPILFVCQPGIVAHFMLGRPDHQGLLVLLFIVEIGLVLRLIEEPDDRFYAIAAGVTAALSLWVSIQALPLVALAIASLGLFWVFGERRFAKGLLVFAVALFGALLAAMLVERGVNRLDESVYDSLSIAHLILFGCNLVFWAGVVLLDAHPRALAGTGGRLAYAILGTIAAGLILWTAAPGLFKSPMDNGDSLYAAAHLARIKELQPLIVFGGKEGTWGQVLAKPILWLGIAIPALPYLLYRAAARQGGPRRAWIFLGILALVFVALAIAQLRWTAYPEIVLLVPYAALAGTLLDWLVIRLPERPVTILRPLLVMTLAVWIYAPTALSGSDGGGAPIAKSSGAACPLRPLSAFLSDPAGQGAAPKRLLAFVDFGPELLYRTPHSVLAIPHHRFQPGFTVSHQIMTADDFSVSRRLLRDYAIDLIVICPGSNESLVYQADTGGLTFYQALSAGEVPDFLFPVELPPSLSQSFKAFVPRGKL
jgi:hypothetical protein